jgi:serine/threonine-protein phosphatase 2A regulatory subunit A
LFSQTLAPAINIPVIEKSVLPMLDKLLSDEIPNIRFNVAKSYGVLIDVLRRMPTETEPLTMLEKQGQTPRLGDGCAKGRELIHNAILPNLYKLQGDQDVDVVYFGSVAAALAQQAP